MVTKRDAHRARLVASKLKIETHWIRGGLWYVVGRLEPLIQFAEEALGDYRWIEQAKLFRTVDTRG